MKERDVIGTIRRRLTYANVTATLALVLAMSAGAWAAFQLPRNSVRSFNIKNGQVKARDIGNNQVRSSDIKDGQVKSADIRDGDITGADIGAGQVTGANIGVGTIAGANIGNGQVGAAQLAQPEPFHLVGSGGTPFGTGAQTPSCVWSNFSSASITPNSPFDPVGFYKDPYGVVHLTGNAESQNGSGGDATCGGTDNAADQTVFILPAADQPPHLLSFPVAFGNTTQTGQLDVNGPQAVVEGSTTIPAGAVFFATGTSAVTRLSLDGIDYRAAGSGTGIQAGRRP